MPESRISHPSRQLITDWFADGFEAIRLSTDASSIDLDKLVALKYFAHVSRIVIHRDESADAIMSFRSGNVHVKLKSFTLVNPSDGASGRSSTRSSA